MTWEKKRQWKWKEVNHWNSGSSKKKGNEREREKEKKVGYFFEYPLFILSYRAGNLKVKRLENSRKMHACIWFTYTSKCLFQK